MKSGMVSKLFPRLSPGIVRNLFWILARTWQFKCSWQNDVFGRRRGQRLHFIADQWCESGRCENYGDLVPSGTNRELQCRRGVLRSHKVSNSEC